MSTTNFDNDPFPVFTPRNSIQQQLGRSPMQQNQQMSHSSSNVNNLLQSPFNTSRFVSTSNQNLINSTRSPSNNIRAQYQSQNLNNDPNRQLLASMVPNLTLNQAPQTPLLNKLQTPSTTPPPTQIPQQTPSSSSVPFSASSQSVHLSSSMASTSQHHGSSAHRKLFQNIENQAILNNNDMLLLNDSNLHHLGPNLNQMNPHQLLAQTQQFHQSDLEPSRVAPADLSNITHLKRSESYFMSDELRSEILRKNLLSLTVPTQEVAIQLPTQVKDYHNLVPLDNQQLNIDHKSRTFGYQTISYKATHIKTNCVYYLKRIMGFRFINQRCAEIVEAWKRIQHANICTLRDVFGTKEFNGEHSIVFVYDYYPGLETLQYRLYNNPNINMKGWANPYNLDGAARPFSAGKTINGSRSLGLLPEQNVWEFVIQLASIIRTIHSANLPCRIVNPSRILVDHKSRLRLSGVGIFDILDNENNSTTIAQYQQDDLIEFGKLVLALACNSLIAIQKEHINTSIEIVNRNFSNDLKSLISHFMTLPANMNGRLKSINDALSIIGPRFYTVLDNAYTRGDIIENDLSKEIENGRLFRLICKLNIVLERQEFNGDLQWSETGDRYMLKLFRDYVFHQITSNGQPWIDLSHIVQCLNKFDTGSNDKICLVSPDNQNIMIVSYAQLKKCFEKVFSEITSTMNT